MWILSANGRGNGVESLISYLAGGQLFRPTNGCGRISVGPAGNNARDDLHAFGRIPQGLGKGDGALWINHTPASGDRINSGILRHRTRALERSRKSLAELVGVEPIQHLIDLAEVPTGMRAVERRFEIRHGGRVRSRRHCIVARDMGSIRES